MHEKKHTVQPTFLEFIPYLYEINAIHFLCIINIFILKHTPFSLKRNIKARTYTHRIFLLFLPAQQNEPVYLKEYT